jgi:hypothetical protein
MGAQDKAMRDPRTYEISQSKNKVLPLILYTKQDMKIIFFLKKKKKMGAGLAHLR